MPSVWRRRKVGSMNILRCAVLAICAAAMGGSLLAQPAPTQPVRPPQETGKPAPVPAPVPAELLAGASKPLFAAAAARAEEQLVPLVLQRTQFSGGSNLRLEAQIDLYVIQRWIATSTLSTDQQAAAAWLRLAQIRQAMSAAQKDLSPANDQGLTDVQQLAAHNLRQLTYDLPAADVAKIDAICRATGISLLEFATGQAVNPSQIPIMRPVNLPTLPQEPSPAPRPREAAVGSSDPGDLIPKLNVSPVLRRQLVRTLDAVQRPEVYDLTAEEARQLARVLKDAIDISAGLASNAGVDLAKRMELEQQLGEALALLQDRRLKELGQRKIEGMSRYRQVLSAIIRLNLSEQNYKLLAPAFQLAERSPEDAKRLIPAVEKFVAFCSAYDKLPESFQYNTDPAILKALQKAYDDSRKGFEASRSAFLGDVEMLGGTGISNTSTADLESRLEEMQVWMDVVWAMGSMPVSLEVLNTFKPKPPAPSPAPGGLERRIAKEVAIAAAPGKSAARKDAAAVLLRMVRLASGSRELQGAKIEGASLDVLRRYTKKTADDLAAKWQMNVMDVMNAASSGGTLDEGKVQRNELLLGMIQTLPRLAAMEGTAKSAGVLQRWADWGLDDRAVEQGVYPTRAAATAALLAFYGDSTEGMRNWEKVRQEQQPAVSFITRAISGAREIPEVKGELPAACAKLLTPLDVTVYALHRRYAIAQASLARPNLDKNAASDIRDALAKAMAQFR